MSRISGSMTAPLAEHVREHHHQGGSWLGLGDQDPRAVNVGETERWMSVAGGAALAVLGLARRSLGGLGLAAIGGALIHRGLTGHCRAYQALGVDTSCDRGAENSVKAQHGVRIEESVTVYRPREELYRFWRNFANLPRIMHYLKTVQDLPGGKTHWVAKGPLDVPVEWDAEIVMDRPDEMISWRSVGESAIDTAGSVHFHPTPDGRGTEVRVNLKYDPPAGKLGHAVAALFGRSPDQEIREDLRRFKGLMETGAVVPKAAQGNGGPGVERRASTR
ncbi:MAG: SRPBCC family protein [Isosphaeraceae bacterium]